MSKNYNKVVYNGETLIDLTQDTVDESKLLAGYTAHAADGRQIVGKAEVAGEIIAEIIDDVLVIKQN